MEGLPDEMQCEFKSEVTRSVAEHEIYIAFRHDAGAVVFADWFATEGKAAFAKFWEDNKADYR